jgi:divalent metal cation (Fe/Co/Zn/Cd) transporter
VPGEELIEEIHSLIRSLYAYDLYPHHFHIHNYISSQELTFHIKIDNHLSIEAGHAIATSIEELIHEKLDMRTTIHIEPIHYNHPHD